MSATVKATLERAAKTFAQVLAATLGAEGIGLIDAAWLDALNISAMAAVLSILTSIASIKLTGEGPSLTNEEVPADVARRRVKDAVSEMVPPSQVVAEANAASPTGVVAGPAADIPTGDPVTVHSGSVQHEV